MELSLKQKRLSRLVLCNRATASQCEVRGLDQVANAKQVHIHFHLNGALPTVDLHGIRLSRWRFHRVRGFPQGRAGSHRSWSRAGLPKGRAGSHGSLGHARSPEGWAGSHRSLGDGGSPKGRAGSHGSLGEPRSSKSWAGRDRSL
ncbi:hypothetical protein ANANG_G00201360 [Anguilla anguilla]|uniref:Uncharacterized protein n=1 Tax=Anguilla anguilla TaxID=7936 RepID=A0A9D3LXY9_ANGAN|nr:hypothetical protein ANANG_G00201360 [Anguilla anguilla]